MADPLTPAIATERVAQSVQITADRLPALKPNPGIRNRSSTYPASDTLYMMPFDGLLVRRAGESPSSGNFGWNLNGHGGAVLGSLDGVKIIEFIDSRAGPLA